tara:strand:- start:1088 stop:2023 length:936 start_codon:yes stop_codon:yes gene_type:complete
VFEKTNNVVLDVGGQGKFDSTQAKYPSILHVGESWWMWYNGRTDDRFTGSIGLATSKDGVRWEKQNNGNPVFKHGEPGTFDSTKVDHPTVLRFGGKFHMWYTAGNAASRYTIGYATSDDGKKWERQNGGRPVLGAGKKGQFDDQVVLHPAVARDQRGLLHLWYNGVGPQKSFRVGHATSRDGIHWTRSNQGQPVLNPSRVGAFDEGYVYNVFVMIEGDKFHMWYSAWAKNDRTTGPNHNGIVHAVSRDGDHWVKDPVPTLTNGPPGSIDEYACFACYLVRRDRRWWMYYSTAVGKGGRFYRVSLAKSRGGE